MHIEQITAWEHVEALLSEHYATEIAREGAQWHSFRDRAKREWPRLLELLGRLYGQTDRFAQFVHDLAAATLRSWFSRAEWLKELDRECLEQPDWFQSQKMLGGVCYVGLYAENLHGVRARILYLQELGITYLHLMPLFEAPAGNSDGGYAVSSYRHVDRQLGEMAQLAELAHELQDHGISLVLDFVFNHTSDEHEWARRAQAGDSEYEQFYFIFPDRTIPDEYERTLREIFPTVRRGSFTWRDDMQKWVWTTFNSFQWDLNYSNPAVFNAMAGEMLFLANSGVEILRLDAVAFIWKRLGTSCENLPEAHWIIQAMNAVARIAAPALLFKSEAIVHPDHVASYISPGECQLSYNPLLMALLWEALATREVKLLVRSMRRFALPGGCAWVNYLRSHDDIGWTFDDDDARFVGIDPVGHRKFLNEFYTGRFPGSFARGLPFQENPETGDARISGALASLAGLERALQMADTAEIQRSIARILMLHSIILSVGGIPLIYLGDELGTLNDYGYVNDPGKAHDSRWVHRPYANEWTRSHRNDRDWIAGRIYSEISRLITLRKQLAAVFDGRMDVVESGNPHVFAYRRHHAGRQLLAICNFSEHSQRLTIEIPLCRDVISGRTAGASPDLELFPYEFLWLE